MDWKGESLMKVEWKVEEKSWLIIQERNAKILKGYWEQGGRITLENILEKEYHLSEGRVYNGQQQVRTVWPKWRQGGARCVQRILKQ